MKNKIYEWFPIIPKINLLVGRKTYSLKVRLNKRTVKNHLINQTNIYANIGCGDAGIKDFWTNIDFGRYPNVDYIFDCRKNLPFNDETVKGLFSEHFFEHLDYTDEVPYFLKNCYRVLQKDGVLRLIVPDAEKYLFAYCASGWEALKKTRPLDENLNDQLMGIQYQTKMQLINEVFRQGGEHKYAWDFETLKHVLMHAGFSKIYKMSYLKSNDQKLQIDQFVRSNESLYVEATK